MTHSHSSTPQFPFVPFGGFGNTRIFLLASFVALLFLNYPKICDANQVMQMDIEKSAEMNQSDGLRQKIHIPPTAPVFSQQQGENVRAGRVKRQHVHDNNGFSVRNLIELVFCFFLPPAAVALHGGPSFKLHIILNVVLCVLGWVPGILHAIWYCFMSGF